MRQHVSSVWLMGAFMHGDGLQHAHRVTVVEWLAESLQGVLLCLIRNICDMSVEHTPYLSDG